MFPRIFPPGMPIRPPHPHPPADPFRVFYMITGVGLLALLSGFSVCLFNIESVDACVDHADYAVGVLKSFGDHVIEWAIALVGAVFDRYPVSGR